MGVIKVLGPLCKNRHRYRGTYKSLRHTSTRQCVQCLRTWHKLYKQKPEVRDALRRSARNYHHRNREKCLKRMSMYSRTKNGRQAAKRSRAKHRESRNASTRAWKEQNHELVSEYNRQYVQTVRGKNIARKVSNNRRVRRSFIPYSAAQLQRRMLRLGNKCIYCGSVENITVDHLMPLALDGFECITNIVPACRPCNTRKNKIHPLVWIKRLLNYGPKLRRRVSRLLKAYERSIRGKKK